MVPTRDAPRPRPAADEAPRVRVLIQDEHARARIVAALEGAGLVVVTASSPADGQGVEGVVVEAGARKRVEAALEAAGEKGGPTVVVVEEALSRARRAGLAAAGADAILPADLDAERLADLVEQMLLAEGEPGTPHHGRPEASPPSLADFVGRSAAMQTFLEVVERVGPADSTLLIMGETGVGKEHLARAIHRAGPRSEASFVTVNCGALPESLLESELFGHEKGAFTGAERARAGRFEQAEGGTLFLDEVGEMPPPLQVGLLNVLQRREVQRLGSEKTIPVDVRVMAATNRDLADDVASGRFREDLFYRLSVVPLTLPPLRERREDLPEMIGTLLRHHRRALDRPDVTGVDADAIAALLAHDWPGNVRELVNVIERAVLLARDSTITMEELPTALGGRAPLAVADPREGRDPATWGPADFQGRLKEARQRVVEAFERAYLEAKLGEHRGRVGRTAKAAGISPRHLYDKMKAYGLRKEDYRRAPGS